MENNSKKIDQSKSESVFTVNTILVESNDIDINIKPSNTGMVVANLYGEVITSGIPFLRMDMEGTTCHIVATIAGSSWFGKVYLDVLLPPKTFDMVCAQSNFANVSVNTTKAECLEIQTKKGDIKVNSKFSKASLSSHFGNISVYGKTQKNLRMEVYTVNGDVSIKLTNVAEMKITASSTNGDVKNEWQETGEFEVRGIVQTHNGDIYIR